MNNSERKNPAASLEKAGILKTRKTHWNLRPEELVEESLKRELGILASNGALVINTGKFTGRSPEDRFIVEDDITRDEVDWGSINKPFKSKNFDDLQESMVNYLADRDVFVNDGYAGADEEFRYSIRVIAQYPWSAQFANNMFLRPSEEEIQHFEPDWHVIAAPEFKADTSLFGTRQENFAIINFTKKTILVGGTGYTGEIKKGIFSVMNFVLPVERDVLPMHCSANVSEEGENPAIFFGLSGTGKTTLSTSPLRPLIGDDEHGWTEKGLFNIEGGCYAKTIDLDQDKEPEIYNAIRHGAILENIGFINRSRTPDYADDSITQNTRVSYPIHHIIHSRIPSVGGHPRNIFFLTADAFGVLPPISRLNKKQAMFHFVSGYTAKVAGTEEGIVDPEATFSACFGAPFMPLHPARYAKMLGARIEEHDTHIWLVNTGWTGGPFGVGSRIKLQYTRAMIRAALRGQLNFVDYDIDPIFGLEFPSVCPEVPSELLNPKNTWKDKAAYDRKANILAKHFVRNFEKYKDGCNEDIQEALPKVINEA
jgi:phosphoenolpyruvate carboxykinase (ATP)